MKKLLTIFAVAAIAITAVAYTASVACDKASASASSCGSKSADLSMVSADTKAVAANCGACPIALGKYGVAAFKVSGMTCGGCESKLTHQFEGTKGLVMVASVSSADGVAKVIYDKSLATDEDFLKAVSSVGYKGEIMSAVAIMPANSSDKSSSCTAEQKVACMATKGASASTVSGKTCTAAEKAACEAKGKTTGASASACCAAHGSGTTSATATTVSDAHIEACLKACPGMAVLTREELAAFCTKFCSSHEKEESKIDTKSSM